MAREPSGSEKKVVKIALGSSWGDLKARFVKKGVSDLASTGTESAIRMNLFERVLEAVVSLVAVPRT